MTPRPCSFAALFVLLVFPAMAGAVHLNDAGTYLERPVIPMKWTAPTPGRGSPRTVEG